MDFSLLFDEARPVPSHAIIALLSVALGGIQLAMEKGTRLHKTLGYTWVIMMAYVAISSFFIYDLRIIGPFSPIHLLSILVLFSLWKAIMAARRGDIKTHTTTMKSLYLYGLIITGSFTLFPGRAMHAVLFG